MMRSEFGPDRSLSGIGGVETGRDAAEFLLLGAQTVQVCSADNKSGSGERASASQQHRIHESSSFASRTDSV